jgi:SMC interacting uncharacterized protein involved in chromosome segregation
MIARFNIIEQYNSYGTVNCIMTIENNICKWTTDHDRYTFPEFICIQYDVPSYIPKSVKDLIMLVSKTTYYNPYSSIYEIATEIKKILTVTLKHELDDFILHHTKETDDKLKETENKLKETEYKLKELEIINKKLINDKKELLNKFELEINKLNNESRQNTTELLNIINQIQINNHNFADDLNYY